MKILTGEEQKDVSDGKHLHAKLYGRVLASDLKKGNKVIETEFGQKLTKEPTLMMLSYIQFRNQTLKKFLF